MHARGGELRAGPVDWGVVVVAGAIVVVSFTLDWRAITAGATPTEFHWGIFALGEALALAAFLQLLWRSRKRPA